MLEPMIHNRLLHSEHRTLDPDEADLFYIPYYITHYIQRTPPGNETDVAVFEYIRSHHASVWNRTRGDRHFTTAGRCWGGVAYHNDYNRSPLSHKVYFLTIEALSGGRAVSTNIKRVYSIPYPSIYHYSADLGLPAKFPWSLRPEMSLRRWLVANVAGARTDLRKVLAKQCASAPHLCTAGLAQNKAVTLQGSIAAYNAYNESTFCLQTPGDTPTRKGLFDSIAVGCVPVLFHPLTAEKQYPFHLPSVSAFSVFIPEEDVLEKGLNVVDYLATIPQSDIERMQAALATAAFRTQWAIDDPPEELGPDALEVILEALWALVRDNEDETNL